MKAMIIADLDAARYEIASLSRKIETGAADRRADEDGKSLLETDGQEQVSAQLSA